MKNVMRIGCVVLLVLCAAPALAATVSAPLTQGCEGSDIVVPIRVEPADGILGIDLDLLFDPAVVEVTSASAAGIAAGMTLITNTPEPGRLEIALFGVTPLAGSGDVVWIAFRAIGPAGSASPLVVAQHDLNEGSVPSTPVHGTILVAPGATRLRFPDDANGAPGQLVQVPITADPSDGYIGVDLEVAWDPAALAAMGVSAAPGLPPDWTAIFNLTGPGTALVAVFGTTPLAATQPLAFVEFLVVGGPGQTSPLDVVHGQVNEGAVPACLDDGLFTICADADQDGFNTCNGDCDDTDPDIHPGALETCDGIDQDCDGTIDNGDASASCDDGNACTDDHCDPASGCYYLPDDANPCSDGSACTTDACADGLCVPSLIVCDDGNPCTDDFCDPASGCYAEADDTNSCTDANACTRDACAAGRCVSIVIVCDDGNACTDDFCDPGTGCFSAPDDTNPCSDGNACTTFDACTSSVCVGGPPPSCNDGNSCTEDSCNPATGCVNASNGSCGMNPRTQGYWKRLCRGPHPSGEFYSGMDVDCVNGTCTFGPVATVSDICDRLTASPPNDKCEQAEVQLMALTLNLCRGRVEASSPIDTQCGGAATVGESATEADALLCDPARGHASCARAQCLAEEINSGQALWVNSLRITRSPDGATVLSWEQPYFAPALAPPPIRYRVWGRARSEAPFELLRQTSQTSFTDDRNRGAGYQYELSVVR